MTTMRRLARQGLAMQCEVFHKRMGWETIIDGLNNIYCHKLGFSLLIRFANFLKFFAKSFKHVQCLKVLSYRCFYLILLRLERILES